MKTAFVIFGATGDLTKRKLLPALYNLEAEERLPKGFDVIAVGRRDLDTSLFREKAAEHIRSHSRNKPKQEIWERLQRKITYLQMDFTNPSEYRKLGEAIRGNDLVIFYFAVAPEFFETITNNLKKGLPEDFKAEMRVMIEKPFGHDLTSAASLNRLLVNAFGEENIYRIDHYLGKEMTQNILFIRFANTIFEPLWNKDYIEQVQIISSERIGVEDRGNYYERSGALSDMLQSHLLQMLSLVAMDMPDSLDTEAIRDKKVEVLSALKPLDAEDLREHLVLGQYSGAGEIPAYREEKNVAGDSKTETFVALRLFLDSERWRGVPFYILTGKRLPEKKTEIIIQFKKFPSPYNYRSDNLLVFKIQPEEGVYLRFNAKRIGVGDEIVPVKMDFCQNCEVGINSPEAYERLLDDAIKGDAARFTRWDEIEHSWRFVDTLKAHKDKLPLRSYSPFTWGPKEAREMIRRDNKFWFNTEDEHENP